MQEKVTTLSDDELEALQERADRGDEEAKSALETYYVKEYTRKREERMRALRAAGADPETPGAW